MPLIPPKPIPLQPERGGIQNLTADMDKLVAPEERTVPQVQTPDLSVKAQKRGGDYGVVAGAQDAVGGLVKGLALLPDTALNLALRKAENMQGLERGTYTRDYFDRVLRSGSYEEAEPLALGLLSIGRGEDLGTGSGIGNVIERTTEFAALAIPFASALNSMAKASKASKAVRAGVGADTGTGTAQMSAFVGPSQTVGGLPRAAVNPVTGKAQGQFAATTVPGKLKEMLLAPYRAAPGTFGGAGRTEIGFGAASGLGAGIELEVYGTSGLTGGLIAPFAAPFVMGAARGIWNSSPTRWIGNKLRGGTVGVADDMNAARQVAEEGTGNVARAEESAAARQQVNETLERARSDPRYADNQRINEAIQEEFGKFFPDGIVPMSVAAQLQDPLTTARTRMALMKSGDQAVQSEIDNTNDILNVIQNYYDDTLSIQVGMGGEAGSAATVVHAFKDEVAALNSGARNELGELTTQLEDLVPGFNQSNRDATGAELRSKIDEARNLQFERAQAKADELGINKDTGGDQLGSAADWQRFSQTVQDEFLPVAGFNSMTADMLPDEIKRVFRKAAQEGDEFRLSFQDWKNVREDLTTSINRLYNNQDSNGAGRLKVFANMWDEFGSGVTAPNRTPGVTSPALATGSQFGSSTGKKYLDYIDWYKTNVAGPFENQIMINVRQRAGGSATQPIYQTGAENVANQFLNDLQGIRAFKNILGAEDTAMNNLRNAFFDKTSRSVVKSDGTVDGTKLQTFINDNDAVIKELGLTDTFLNIAKAEEQLSARMADLTNRSNQINRNKFRRTMSRFDDENLTETEVIDQLVNSNNLATLSQARQAAADQGVTQQFNQAVLDSVYRRVFPTDPIAGGSTGSIINNPQNFKRWISNKKNRAMLDEALGREHTDQIQLLADFADRVATVLPKNERGDIAWSGLSGQGNTFIDKVNKAVGTSIPGASARFIAVQEGRIGFRTALAYFTARAINSGASARYEAVLNEALTNPAFAREMMKNAPAEAIPAGQTALPLARPRAAATDFFFQRGVPAGVILGTQQLTGGLDTPIETEEVTEVVAPAPTQAQPVTPQFQYPVPQDDPNQNMRPFTLNPSPSGQASAPAPDPAPQGIAATQQQQPTANFEELFPFDSTGQAIQRRRSGIGSLV